MLQKTRKKFLACVLMVGADKRHQQSVFELNNMCLPGQNNCPTSVEGEVAHLAHHMDEKNRNCTGEQNDGHRETSFTQDNITCCYCRKPGNKVPDCPEKKNAEISDSDNDSVSASSKSSESHKSSKSKRAWHD